MLPREGQQIGVVTKALLYMTPFFSKKEVILGNPLVRVGARSSTSSSRIIRIFCEEVNDRRRRRRRKRLNILLCEYVLLLVCIRISKFYNPPPSKGVQTPP